MFWQSKIKVAEAFHTFSEEEIAELLPKIKTRQEEQVIKGPVHVKAMIMPFTLLRFRLALSILLRRLSNIRERYKDSFVLSGNTFSSSNDLLLK